MQLLEVKHKLCCVVCFSARKLTCERERGAKRDWGAGDVGGTSWEAEWRTTRLRGGVQHTCRTAGQSGKHTHTCDGFWWQIIENVNLLDTDRLPLFFCWQHVVDTGLDTELSINLSVPLSNVSFRVCAYTGAGPGPWTPTQTLTLIAPGEWQEMWKLLWLLTVYYYDYLWKYEK